MLDLSSNNRCTSCRVVGRSGEGGDCGYQVRGFEVARDKPFPEREHNSDEEEEMAEEEVEMVIQEEGQGQGGVKLR